MMNLTVLNPTDQHDARPETQPEPTNDRAAIQALKQRECAGCTACCGPALLINQPDLVKPAGKSCSHLRGRGCAVWDDGLPQLCRNFLCNYLIEPSTNVGLADRPDHCGAIIRRTPERILVNEVFPGGIRRTLGNAFWCLPIREKLMQGRPVCFTLADDGQLREVIHLTMREERLVCELTTCHPDGRPRLRHFQPVRETPIEVAAMFPDQDFPFEAERLANELGDQPFLVTSARIPGGPSTPIHFLFTQRQAELTRTLRTLLDSYPIDPRA